MSTYLHVLPLAAGIVATGFSALHVLRLEEPSRLLRTAYAIAVGSALTMLALYLPLMLVDRVVFWPAVALLGVGSVHAAMLLLTRLGSLPGLRPGLHATLVLVALGGPMVASGLVPFRGYDSKAIFALKGKVLLYERDVNGPLFQDVDLVHYHPDYPLGIPLLMAMAGWVAEGEPEDIEGARPAQSAEEWVARHDAVNAYMVLAMLWVVGIVCAVAGFVRRHVRGALTSAALIAIALPVVVVFPAVGYGDWRSVAAGDRPLALCLGVAGLAFARWFQRGQRSWLAVAMLCAAGALLAKNEALVAVAALALAGLAGARRRRALAGGLALAAAAVLALLIVHEIRSRTAGAPYDEQYVASLTPERVSAWLRRIPRLIGAIWSTLRAGDTLGFWLVFGLLAVPVAWRTGGGARVLLVWILLYQLLCAAVMLVTPNHLVWHVNTAANRLWFQMTIPAAYLLVEAVVLCWSRSTEGTPAHEQAVPG